ncbi:MAG: 50S ribosomal protein L21 [Dehalococcoidia bacterium]|nr:50S ribosomal protein L21 [Dehalococcoidia bacterium]
MNDYAIIKTGGKQYAVTPGRKVKIEKIEGSSGDKVNFDQVLLTSLDGKISIGSPNVKNATVIGEIQDQVKNDKVTTFKYHNKTRYRVRRGHRQLMTDVLIKDIENSISTKKVKKDSKKSTVKSSKTNTKKTSESRK